MTGDAAAKPQRADTVRSVQGESQGSIEGNARSDAQVPLRSSAAQPCRSLFLGSRRSSSARQPFLCVSLFALFISSPLSLSRLETAKARFADRKGLVDSRGGPTVPVFLSSLPCLLAPPRGWAPPPPGCLDGPNCTIIFLPFAHGVLFLSSWLNRRFLQS